MRQHSRITGFETARSPNTPAVCDVASLVMRELAAVVVVALVVTGCRPDPPRASQGGSGSTERAAAVSAAPATTAAGSATTPAGPAGSATTPAAPVTTAAEAYRLVEEARKVAFARLVALGQRILASLPPPPPYTPDLVAVGPCVRPTAEERTTLRRAIAATTPGARPASLMLGFGCKDPGGVVVDVAYERAARGKHVEGVWRVVHVEAATAGAHVTTLAELVRVLAASPDDDDRRADESKLATLALIDLDGDGSLDPVVARIFARTLHHDIELAVWCSARRGLTAIGTVPDVVSIDVPREQASPPLVLRIRPFAQDLQIAYRCVEASGTLDRCPAIARVRRSDEREQIARAFADSTYSSPGNRHGLHELDRELLAEFLDTLDTPRDERASLLALVPPGRPEILVARAIARVRTSRADDALLQPPDPRPATLLALLGDARCTAATAAATTAARAEIAAWIHDHDARDLRDHGMCTAATRCDALHPTELEIQASCVAGERAYYTASWSYLEVPSPARNALFYLAGGVVTRVASAADPRHSSQTLATKLYRHGGALVALLLWPDEIVTGGGAGYDYVRRRAYAIDGVLTDLPTRARTDWYRFGQIEYAARGALDADDLIAEWSDSRGEVALWHWDGAWTQVVAFPLNLHDRPASAGLAARWLWDQAQLTLATKLLHEFQYDFMAWRTSAERRADTTAALVTVGADPSIIARVKAEAERATLAEPHQPRR